MPTHRLELQFYEHKSLFKTSKVFWCSSQPRISEAFHSSIACPYLMLPDTYWNWNQWVVMGGKHNPVPSKESVLWRRHWRSFSFQVTVQTLYIYWFSWLMSPLGICWPSWVSIAAVSLFQKITAASARKASCNVFLFIMLILWFIITASSSMVWHSWWSHSSIVYEVAWSIVGWIR